MSKVAERKEVRCEFVVGKGSRSYTRVWVMLPSEKRFSKPVGEKEAYWVSTRKQLYKLRLTLPVGTLVKVFEKGRKGAKTAYYLVTEEGLKPLEVRSEDRVVREMHGWQIVVRRRTLVDGDRVVGVDARIVFPRGRVPELTAHLPAFYVWDDVEEREAIGKLEEAIRKVVALRATIYLDHILLEGDTFPLRERLKELGFRWMGSYWLIRISELVGENALHALLNELKRMGFSVQTKTSLEKITATFHHRWVLNEKGWELVKRVFPPDVPIRSISVTADGEVRVYVKGWLDNKTFKKLRERFPYYGYFVVGRVSLKGEEE